MSPGERSGSQQCLDRNLILDDRGFDNDIAVESIDSELGAVEQTFHGLLEMANTAGDKAQQVIVAAADHVAFKQTVDGFQVPLEAAMIFAAMLGQCDLGEYGDAVGDLGQVDSRPVGRDVLGRLETFDPLQAGAGR